MYERFDSRRGERRVKRRQRVCLLNWVKKDEVARVPLPNPGMGAGVGGLDSRDFKYISWCNKEVDDSQVSRVRADASPTLILLNSFGFVAFSCVLTKVETLQGRCRLPNRLEVVDVEDGSRFLELAFENLHLAVWLAMQTPTAEAEELKGLIFASCLGSQL